MANVNHLNVSDTIDSISSYAPLVIFIMMITMFSLTGWLQYHFLSGVLQGKFDGVNYLVFVFPVVVQVLRFVTGFLSASFFKKGKWVLGGLVLCFSVWLSIFEFSKVNDMADFWTNIDISTEALTHSSATVSITQNIIKGIMTVLIWGALVLECFLAFWVGSSNREGHKTSSGEMLNEERSNEVSFSTNGVA